jgi:hypothetical protein
VTATLHAVQPEEFTVSVRLPSGDVVDALEYEDVCKLDEEAEAQRLAKKKEKKEKKEKKTKKTKKDRDGSGDERERDSKRLRV